MTTYRTFLANIGQVVAAFCVPLLAGQFSKTMGIGQSWQLTMAIMDIIGGILYIKPSYILSNKHYNKMFIAFCNYFIINCKVMKDLI
ncbi:hypothetical protein [Clostridium beijerinckii]|uniref:hypothetical protein n=1 Tax=Clostridium beijerinckii TaxID=1520 RepID=UPI0004798254|nr:hypothetical protein [Clostridium beijerinckii]